MYSLPMEELHPVGRLAILEAAKNLTQRISGAGHVVYTTEEGSPHLFALALRRIGEDKLAHPFIDAHFTVHDVVYRRVHGEEILTAILDSIERGDVTKARSVEDRQRRDLHLKGVGYLHPGRSYFFRKRGVRQSLRERVVAEGTAWKETNCSFDESVYAVYANLALGRVRHARNVLGELQRLYFDNDLELYCGETPLSQRRLGWARTASVARAMDLAGMEEGRALFDRSYNKIMEGYEVSQERHAQLYNFLINNMAALIFALDHFDADATAVRERLVQQLPTQRDWLRDEIEVTETFQFGKLTYAHEGLCIAGLALVGLGQTEAHRFYV
jgi:hypothetical protein